MRKFLLVLWLVGAGVYTLNTLVLTHTITGANDKLASVTEEDLAAQTLLLPQPKEAVAEPRPDAGALPVATTDEPDPRLRLDRKQLHDRMADNHHGLSGASSPAIPDNDSAPSELAVRAEQAEAVKNVEPTEAPVESREEQVAVQSSAPDEMAAEEAFAEDRDEPALERAGDGHDRRRQSMSFGSRRALCRARHRVVPWRQSPLRTVEGRAPRNERGPFHRTPRRRAGGWLGAGRR